MDRERLRRFLDTPHRTFRWNDGETREHYDAVETTDAGLLWYGWSHRAEGGGKQNEERQSFESYRARGPARPMPAETRAQLEETLRALGELEPPMAESAD